MIFRLLCAQFGLVGISEKGHKLTYGKNAFLPTDPEHALLIAGVIDLGTFGEIFIERVRNALSICDSKGFRALIREHTHSYFFQDQSLPVTEDYPSWIAGELYKKSGILSKCIMTVRDPIDSWMGLERSFPRMAPKNFDQYCTSYLNFLKSAGDKVKHGEVLLVRYEDVIEDPQNEIKRIGAFIGELFTGELTSEWHLVASSGNSGRQSQEIKKRKRRAIDFRLFQDAKSSSSYRELISILDYPNIRETSSITQKFLSPAVQLERYGATMMVAVKKRVRKWARARSYIRPT